MLHISRKINLKIPFFWALNEYLWLMQEGVNVLSNGILSLIFTALYSKVMALITYAETAELRCVAGQTVRLSTPLMGHVRYCCVCYREKSRS